MGAVIAPLAVSLISGIVQKGIIGGKDKAPPPPTPLPAEVKKDDEVTVQANIAKEQQLRRSCLKSIRNDSIKTSPLGLVDAPATETTLLGG